MSSTTAIGKELVLDEKHLVEIKKVEWHEVVKQCDVNAAQYFEAQALHLIQTRTLSPRILIPPVLHHSRSVLFQKHVEKDIVWVILY